MSPDPLSETPEYVYASNNPLRLLDPNGLADLVAGFGGGTTPQAQPPASMYVGVAKTAATVLGSVSQNAAHASEPDETPRNRANYGERARRNYQLGLEGERMAGITAPKKRIDSLSEKAEYRIPDELLEEQKILREIKNVEKLSYTAQLRDFVLWTQKFGYQFILEVRESTKLSKRLLEQRELGRIEIRTFRK